MSNKSGTFRPVRRAYLILACIAALLLTSCVPPGGGREYIGTLRVSGNAVMLNGNIVHDSATVRVGDRVSTGAASSARVDFRGGGFVQLDEHTDPDFSFRIVDDSGRRCIHLFIKFGQVFIDSDITCFETPDMAGNLGSSANIRIAGGTTQMSLFTGRARIMYPQVMTVTPGEQVSSKGGRITTRRLSKQEQAWVSEWRKRYAFDWCCTDGRVYQSDERSCRNNRGTLHSDRNRAERACHDMQQGYCCSNGKVFRSTYGECNSMRGAFDTNHDAVARNCRAPELSGWCCASSKGTQPFQSTANQCSNQKGRFYNDYSVAAKNCQPPEPAGWCCINYATGVHKLTQQQCKARSGTFYTNERLAHRACTLQ